MTGSWFGQVEEATLHCGEEERDEFLYYLLAAHPGRTLVFANAVSTARRIAALLHILKLPSAALHAGENISPVFPLYDLRHFWRHVQLAVLHATGAFFPVFGPLC